MERRVAVYAILALFVLAAAATGSGGVLPDTTRAAVTRCELSWRPVPFPEASFHDRLSGIAARSPYDVWVVGGDYSGHWNGSGWTSVPVARVDGELHDVAVAPNGEAWAVGETAHSALIEHWDGRGWQRVSLPANAADPRRVGVGARRTLNAVAAVSPTDVWAVGTDWRHYTPAQLRTGRVTHPRDLGVVLHWNGHSWRLVRLRARAVWEHDFLDVAGAGDGAVWVVGGASYANQEAGIALRLYGGQWHSFGLHGPSGTDYVSLEAVTGVGGHEVMVVGTAGTGAGHFTGESWGLVFRFNGRRWSARVPDYNGSYASYDAVAARTPRDVWIADNDSNPFHQADGTQLFAALHPESKQRTTLGQGGIAESLAFDGRDIWAVGGTGNGRLDENDFDYARFSPLIERYSC